VSRLRRCAPSPHYSRLLYSPSPSFSTASDICVQDVFVRPKADIL